MRRIFGLSSRGQVPSGPAGLQGSFGGPQHRVRPRSMGKLHKAASVGNTAKVQHLLIMGKSGVNDRDKKHRTALHFACTSGHPEVVTLLVDRKCEINACDSENSTPLIKAVQCHQEECVTILLEHGADPNIADVSSNTALHYAVSSENTSIAAKLLSHHAKTEAKNKDDLTPYLLALKDNKQQVAELLIKEKANIHAVDKPRRFSNKPCPDDSWHTSDVYDYNFDNKVPQINPTELWPAVQQSRKHQAKYGIEEPGNKTLLDNSISHSESNDVVVTLSKTSVNVQSFSQSSFLSPTPDPKVSVSHEDLLPKNHRLQVEIARLRLERDAIKNQNQVKEKKYLEDTEIEHEKNDDLQKTIKLTEERIFQCNGQLNSLTENTLLNSKLEKEKQIKERPETETESHRSSLGAAGHNYESQTSNRDVELASQRGRNEQVRLQDKLNFAISNLKNNYEMLSQQLSQAERKFSSLGIELRLIRDALRENTSVLQQIQRDVKQTQCPMKEIKHMNQDEEGKVNKYMGTQESIEERLSQLESENALLRHQLDDTHKKLDYKERTLINIQNQFHGTVKTLLGESKKQTLKLEDRNKEVMDECNHLKENTYQYEKEKAEKEVVVRQLQQELADALKKQSMPEASLEVSSLYHINLEDETRDLKKKLSHIRSLLEEERNRHKETVRYTEKLQGLLQKLKLENFRLKSEVKKQKGEIEQLQKNLLSTNLSEGDKEQLKKFTALTEYQKYTLDEEKRKNGELRKELTGFKKLYKMTEIKLNEQENGDFRFHGDLKSNELDIPINMLIHKVDDLAAKLETASFKCLHLDKSDFLQQELLSMKNILQKKCETLEKNEKKLEEEVVNLRNHVEENGVKHGQAEQYKQETEERVSQELVEKLKEVNLFSQIQAASQEIFQQLRETNNASMRSQTELIIEDLQAEVSKMKPQGKFNKIELEKYSQCYLELKSSESLSSEPNNLYRANRRLQEANNKILVEQQQNPFLLSSVNTKPLLEYPCVGNLHHSLVFPRSFLPRENFAVPPLNPKPSISSMESYLAEMQQKLH
ncbi:ankyrin repeat domain-containing protein 26-like isoform X2 [Heterocephalus glaber]|uniref:Ankyrin repeat domain-containing protein 26-like isoform X2 n=1 Tax=Heterocephalus glaber TaxID=10181 RepID=A0AAX6RTY6_HETGA|nr:ankyrin repeat domain-containing protein 26-like isoform X2 [Heterocephalus glaber]